MITFLKTFKFYLKYYMTNHVINRIPSHRLRLCWYRHAVGIKIGERTQIWLGCQFIGDTVDQIEIGNDTVLASGAVINASAPVKIGDFVRFAQNVSIYTSDYDCQDPEFRPRYGSVTVNANCFVAAHAIILKGVTLGEGAVITAGAVVFQDIKPFTIAGGNPARTLGSRVMPAGEKPLTGTPPLFC